MKVVHPGQLPPKSPLPITALMWLLFDRLEASGWAWGVLITLLAIWWVGWFLTVVNAEWTYLKELSGK